MSNATHLIPTRSLTAAVLDHTTEAYCVSCLTGDDRITSARHIPEGYSVAMQNDDVLCCNCGVSHLTGLKVAGECGQRVWVKLSDHRYDYENQAWIIEGRYIDCSHPSDMGCGCYGKLHQGEVA